MRNFGKQRKKKGFTLIEMVAVVAIIGILAAILVPKVTGYMNEAKKTKVIDQARKVVQAFESTKMKGKIEDSQKNVAIADLTHKTTGNETFKSFLLGGDSVGNILPNIAINTVTYQNCYDLVNNIKEYNENNKDDILQEGELATVN